MLKGVDYHVLYILIQGAWSVFWSYAPTPQPNTWYNAWFHVAQFLALNPGRSQAVAAIHKKNGNENTNH
jgi:hypothetical protein